MRIPHRHGLPDHLVEMLIRNTDTDLAAAAGQPAVAEQRAGGESLLDNPILNALLTEHDSLALADGAARRYPPGIGPLAGAPDQSQQSYDGLRALAGAGGLLGLFLDDEPELPKGWTLFRSGILTQMICREPRFQTSACFPRRQRCDGSARLM